MKFREMRATPGIARRRLTVADIMTAGPRVSSPSGDVREAIVIIRDEDRGAVTVVVEPGPVGAVTGRDVAPFVADHPDLADSPVSDLTSRGVRPVRSDDLLDVVKEKFGDPKVRRLVVIDPGNQVLGIITRADLVPPWPEEDVGEVVEEVVDRAPSLDGKGGSGSW